MGRRLEQLELFEFFLYIIAGWITIGLWQRFIENFFYNGIGLERELPYHNFIVMFIMTAIFLVVVSFVSSLMENSQSSNNSEIDQFNPGLTVKSVRVVNGKNHQRTIDLYPKAKTPNVHGIGTKATMEKVQSPRLNGGSRYPNKRSNRSLSRRNKEDLSENSFHRVDSILSGFSERDGGDAPIRSYSRRHNS